MSGVSNSITNFRDTVTNTVDSGRNWAGGLSDALDFGDNPPKKERARPVEQDVSTIDRTNPINHNGFFNRIPAPVYYGVGALVALGVLKKLGII